MLSFLLCGFKATGYYDCFKATGYYDCFKATGYYDWPSSHLKHETTMCKDNNNSKSRAAACWKLDIGIK